MCKEEFFRFLQEEMGNDSTSYFTPTNVYIQKSEAALTLFSVHCEFAYMSLLFGSIGTWEV